MMGVILMFLNILVSFGSEKERNRRKEIQYCKAINVNSNHRRHTKNFDASAALVYRMAPSIFFLTEWSVVDIFIKVLYSLIRDFSLLPFHCDRFRFLSK